MDHTPVELLDIIFAELHSTDWEKNCELPLDGKADLHACSLVSRSWRESAQRHLFRDTTYCFRSLPGGTDIPPERSARVYSRDRTLAMFLGFIRQSPRFAPYIRALRLEFWPQDFPPSNYGPIYEGPDVVYRSSDVVDGKILHTLLHSLPALVALQLCNVNVTETEPIPLYSPRLSLSHLSLWFHRETYGIPRNNERVTNTTIVKLLSLVECTKELLIFNGYTQLAGLDTSIGTPHDISTDGIFFSPSDHALRVLALSQPTLARSIRRLVLDVWFVVPDGYQPVLSAIGEQLIELRIRHMLLQPDTPLDLSCCRNLQSYTLGFWSMHTYECTMSDHETLLQTARESIESLPQKLPALRELVVDLSLRVDHIFDTQVWVTARSASLGRLERSLRNVMDRCDPPLEHVTLRSQVELFRERVDDDASALLAHIIFPGLEEEGRVKICPHDVIAWRSFYNY